MIITLPKLAEAMKVAFTEFQKNFGKNDDVRLCSGTLVLSYLLQAMSLKTPDETMSDAYQRLKETPPKFDLLNGDHRNLMSKILHDMYAPLGVSDVVILGRTPENKVFITTMHEGEGVKTDIEQIKLFLQAIANTEDSEGFDL